MTLQVFTSIAVWAAGRSDAAPDPANARLADEQRQDNNAFERAHRHMPAGARPPAGSLRFSRDREVSASVAALQSGTARDAPLIDRKLPTGSRRYRRDQMLSPNLAALQTKAAWLPPRPASWHQDHTDDTATHVREADSREADSAPPGVRPTARSKAIVVNPAAAAPDQAAYQKGWDDAFSMQGRGDDGQAEAGATPSGGGGLLSKLGKIGSFLSGRDDEHDGSNGRGKSDTVSSGRSSNSSGSSSNNNGSGGSSSNRGSAASTYDSSSVPSGSQQQHHVIEIPASWHTSSERPGYSRGQNAPLHRNNSFRSNDNGTAGGTQENYSSSSVPRRSYMDETQSAHVEDHRISSAGYRRGSLPSSAFPGANNSEVPANLPVFSMLFQVPQTPRYPTPSVI